MTKPILSGSLLRRRNGDRPSVPAFAPQHLGGLLSQELFAHMLYVERKRTERSGRKFVLMLLESSRLLRAEDDRYSLEKVLLALSRSTRDTDVKGWYRNEATIGVIFTELGADVDGRGVAGALLSKVTKALSDTLTIDQINQVRLVFHVYPDDFDLRRPADHADSAYYDELLHRIAPKELARAVKRCLDISGSLLALSLSLPLWGAIALAVKLTSKGPILFRQERVGQYGRRFQFLKFRSMFVNSDDAIHRKFVEGLIDGTNGSQYKLTADPRVTRVGRFLRRTSLDELPQFLNVLLGEMSLVGPRPPLPYEVARYQAWHRARILAAKPGITGLWQVGGRSRVKFDDMVRMDLRYAASWSLWLDLKILLKTPYAVLSANGAH